MCIAYTCVYIYMIYQHFIKFPDGKQKSFLPGFRRSSTQEDAMDFNLNCRRRLPRSLLKLAHCGWPHWGVLRWFQHVRAINIMSIVDLWWFMSFPCWWSNDWTIVVLSGGYIGATNPPVKRRETRQTPSRSSETSTHRSRGRRLEHPNSSEFVIFVNGDISGKCWDRKTKDHAQFKDIFNDMDYQAGTLWEFNIIDNGHWKSEFSQ